MASQYPGGIDSFTTKQDGVHVVYAADMNDVTSAICAIENELSTDPRGSFASVAAAIAAIPGKLSTSGGNLTGDVTCNSGVKVDGVDISAHTHSGASGDAGNIRWADVSGKPFLPNSVIYSKVDASGFPNYISAGTGLSVDIDGSPTPILMDIAGEDQSITTDTTISSLSASSTCYLYAESTAGGTPALGHSTLKPVYAYTAPGSPSADQHWLDLSVRQMLAAATAGVCACGNGICSDWPMRRA
jgi:hypothetical protein